MTPTPDSVFSIVPGVSTSDDTPVWRVVEWRGERCLGGRGAFLALAAAEAFIATGSRDAGPLTVDGMPVVRVVIDVRVSPAADSETMARLGEVLAERMGDNLDAVLGVNDLMIDHDVRRWWVRYTPTTQADGAQDR